MKKKTHKDIEFEVHFVDSYDTFRTRKRDEAFARAVALACSGRPVTVDVLCYSKAGAKWFHGDEGVEIYNEDPDASVFERIVVTADPQGRVA